LAGLLGDRGRDSRMSVAGVGHADPAGVVQVALAVDGLDPGADAALHHEVGVARPDRRDAAAQFEPIGHRLATGAMGAPSAPAARPVRRWAQICTTMKTNAIRKKIVPRALTSGGMPIRLAPYTQSGKVTVWPALKRVIT